MTDALTTIQVVSNALYLLLGLVALRLWLRDRNARGAKWVAATFVSGGVLVASSLYLGPDAQDIGVWVVRFQVGLLLALPVSLHRFVTTLEGRQTFFGRAAEVGAAALFIVTLGIPSFPGPDEEPTTGFVLYTFAFMAVWAALNGRAAFVLLLASRRQPHVIRRRLQVLASGAIGLSLAIVLPSLSPESETLAVQGAVAGALSGVLFLVGFVPPRVLRARWREPEELALHEATRQLMLAAHRDEIARTLLPCMTSLVGARGSALLDRDGKVVGQDGDVPDDPAAALDSEAEDVLVVPVSGRQHVVLWTSPWSPMLGEDERRLLERLTVLSDLALDRADLFEAERNARAEAERANHEVEAFVATITHDLRNPLTTIGGMADLLLGPLQEDLTERAEGFVGRIRANATYMGALVDDILALAEVGQSAGRVESVDLHQIADSVAVEAQMRAPLATVAVHDLPMVLGDPVRLRRLVENVVGNAMKHGGREDIRIDITSVQPDPEWLELRFLDNGQGIPPEASEKIFGVFERLEGRGKGTGLGLAICRKLVEQFGGSMWFASSQGGADVRIRIPAHLVIERPAAAAKPSKPTALPEPTSSQEPVATPDTASLPVQRTSSNG